MKHPCGPLFVAVIDASPDFVPSAAKSRKSETRNIACCVTPVSNDVEPGGITTLRSAGGFSQSFLESREFSIRNILSCFDT